MTAEESFFGRWSRLKQAERDTAAKPDPAPQSQPPEVELPDAGPALGDEAEQKAEAELPTVESLDAQSDYSGFMREGVPEALRRQALRKLWTSDPVLALPEVLDANNLDFTLPKTPQVVATLFRVGRGMIDAVEEAAEKAAAEVARDDERKQVNAEPGLADQVEPEPQVRLDLPGPASADDTKST